MSKTKPLFYVFKVLDNQDPLMLGRVRAESTVHDNTAAIGSITNPPYNEEKDKWTSRDPFLFNPLLPYFLYQVPKKDELIYVFYYNSDYKYQNQFYVQGSFSNPTTSPGEYIEGMKTELGLGGQYKNPLELKCLDNNGSYVDPPNFGVFPEPGDNAIMGRGSADLIVKEDEVLLRAGKTIGNINPNQIPAANNTRAYLQLSKFDSIKILDEVKTFVQNNEVVVSVKYLIEWVITNPENNENKFAGSVYLYKLKPDLKTNSAELKVDTNVDEFKSLIHERNFVLLSKNDTIKFINNFINECNNDWSTFSVSRQRNLFQEQPFPIFYRPSNKMYEFMTSKTNTTITPIIQKNVNQIYNGIKLNNTTLINGWGLIYTQDKVGTPTTTKNIQLPIYKYNNTPLTFASVGANKICFLSHNSTIPGKGKINFDGTLYGITNDVYSDEIVPKTSSSVRGEELLELLNYIVRFMVTHTHAFPGLPPVPVTQDGSNVTTLLSLLQNAPNKVLNEHIRLN